MSTHQDIYVASFENRPPMLNKDNYVPWFSRLLRYAKTKPNGKLIHNYIMHGPYVKRMIPEPGDPDREVHVAETFHEQTNEKLNEKEIKQIEADDQSIQTILMGLPEDIYAAVDSYPTTAMNMALILMAKAFKLNYSTHTNNNQRISSNPRNSLDSMLGRMLGIRIGIANQNANQNRNGNVVAAWAEGNGYENNKNQVRCYNYRGMGHLARNSTVRPRRRDVAYLQTQLLIAQKVEAGIQLQAKNFDLMAAAWDLDEIKEVNANCILMENLQQASTSVTQTDKDPVYDSDGSAERFVSQNTKSHEELYFSNNSKTASVSKSILLPNEEFSDDTSQSVARKFLNDVKSTILTLQHVVKQKMILDIHNWSSSAHQELHKIIKDEIFPIVNQVDARVQNFKIQFLKEASKFVRDFKSLAKEADECLPKHKALEYEIESLLKVVIERLQDQLGDLKDKSKDTPWVSDTLDPLSQKLEDENVSLEFQLSKTPNHRSSESYNIKLAIRNERYEVVCATCKQCLITANHDECVFKYVNGMNSSKKNQSANVSKSANQKKHKPNVKKLKTLGSDERLASPRTSKPRTYLRWLATGRIFDLCGKITASSNTESESDTSVCDKPSASNPQEPTSKAFPYSTSFLDRFTRLQRLNTCIHPLAVL
ncbi:hypothetical protein Tco_0788144 [Tanacetum coccineum]